MSNLFTTAHIAQLHEIQAARLKRNHPGIGPEVEELIRRLTDGGVAGTSGDIREFQAKRLWDIGVGKACGLKKFKAYLASIPEIPSELVSDDTDFPLLVLIEPRTGLKKLCDLGGIDFSGNDETFVAYDDRHRELTQPTWIRIQDGRKNRTREARDCRKSFGKREMGLTALQGVCCYLQYPDVVSEATQAGAHVMDLSGSVHRGHRDDAACLMLWYGQPGLDWNWDDNAYTRYGSASRRECKAL